MRERCPGWTFRRQRPIGNYIVDFACSSAKLAIELDGGQHAERTAEDAARTAGLAEHGYRVVRFWNNDILANIDGVLMSIAGELGISPA